MVVSGRRLRSWEQGHQGSEVVARQTGFADRDAMEGISETHVVRKPFTDADLANKVRLALIEGASEKVVRLRRTKKSEKV